ncbi:MAG: alpha/beta fold hydrolase [Clostridia bacterium]|nr:alpha/beta fold hydrolase [Clostridia bacterium]
MKRILSLFMVLVVIITSFAAFTAASSAEEYAAQMPEIKEYGFITADDGAKIEYGIYGDLSKDALIMLPCNGGDMHNFDGNLLPEFAEHFKVIAVSPRGTGNSERGTGELTFDLEAEDLLCLLDELEIEKAHFFGYSDGGNLAIVFAVNYPDRVLSLVPVGANISPWGTKINSQIPIITKYIKYAIEAFLTKDPEIELRRDIQKMMVTQPSLKFKDLEKITAPTLNIYADDDMMYSWHSQRITRSIPDAEELRVPDSGHSDILEFKDELFTRLFEFYKNTGAM